MAHKLLKKIPLTANDIRCETFASAYLTNGCNATNAYKAVYPRAQLNTAQTNGCKWLHRAKIQHLIKKKYEKSMKKFEINLDRILHELACIAFLDIADVVNDDGSLKPVTEMPEHARRALASISMTQITGKDSDKVVAVVKKMRANSKEKALELLGKHHGMFIDKVEHSGNVGLNIVDLLDDLDDTDDDD